MKMKYDRTKILRARPPTATNFNTITVTLNAEDYETLYNLAVKNGLCLAEQFRRLIRQLPKENQNV